tara:strand:- start:18758 stop:19153 length:396 start_codon:yes stop_codon:yes gene_type:complete
MDQKNKYDYHAWNVDKNGNIKDQLNKHMIDFISMFKFGHDDYTLIYKEWKKYPEFYNELKKKKEEIINTLTKKEKVEYLKTDIPLSCMNYAILKNHLFEFDIKFGSLGLQCNKTKEIHWEYGNGLEESDYK